MFFTIAYSEVGERMKKIMDKLFAVDKKVVVFLSFITFIGIITGALYMTVLSTTDKTLVADTLQSFLEQIEPANYLVALRGNLLINCLFMLAIWILGFSVIGLMVVIAIVFYKAFVVSFSISSFIVSYGWKGTIMGFLYNFPHQIIMLIIYLYLGSYAMKVSALSVHSIMKRKSLDFKLVMNRYLIISFVIVVMTTIFETFLTPRLLKYILNML